MYEADRTLDSVNAVRRKSEVNATDLIESKVWLGKSRGFRAALMQPNAGTAIEYFFRAIIRVS